MQAQPATPGTPPPPGSPIAWPPDYMKELDRRYKRQKVLGDDRELQTAAMVMYGGSVAGCIKWIEDYCVTFDPRRKHLKRFPLMLFPKQKQFVRYLYELWQTGESGLVEKCRDIGATWLCCAFSVWLWLFHAGSTIGWGSRKAEYVDDSKNPKAIFPKIRQIIDNLPFWMVPEGFDPRRHSVDMKIINPINEATITGEAGDGIGRGGRTTIYFKDESAHYERPEKIEAALGDNTDVQIDISSVNGSANVFYRRRMAETSKIWKPGEAMTKGFTRVFIFDWRDHPGKTQTWYDERKRKADAEGLLHIFYQEVDRDYAGSVEGIIIPGEYVRAAIDAHIKLAKWGDWFGGGTRAAQDVADGGGDRNATMIKKGAVYTGSQLYGGEAGDAARKAVPFCVEHSADELYYDSIGVGSGFKVEINRMTLEKSWPKRLRVFKWDASGAVLDPTDPIIPGDDQSPTNEDQYENVKAQSWFRTRAKFVKTFKAVTRGERFPVHEMISISSKLQNVHQLVMEFSQPVAKISLHSGKTMVDKKPKGSVSPNLADAAIMADNPLREVSRFDIL